MSNFMTDYLKGGLSFLPGEQAELAAALRGASALQFGATVTTNTTLTAAALDTIVPISTGSSIIVMTLAAGITAGSVQYMQKVDQGTGYVVVKDETGAVVDVLAGEEYLGAYSPDEDGSGWSSLFPTRKFRLGSNRFLYPFPNPGIGDNAAGSPAADTIYCIPIELDGARMISGLGLTIKSTTPSNWLAKCALYDWDPSSPNSPAGAPLLSAAGSELGTPSGTTGKSSQVSTFTPVRISKTGRAWAVYKSNTTIASAGIIMATGPIGEVVGGSGALQLAGFTSDVLKGFSWGSQTYASAFPANLPGSPTELLAYATPALFPRIG